MAIIVGTVGNSRRMPQYRSKYFTESGRLVHRWWTPEGIIEIRCLQYDSKYFIMVFDHQDKTQDMKVFGEAKMLGTNKKLYWIHSPLEQELDINLDELQKYMGTIAYHLLNFYQMDS